MTTEINDVVVPTYHCNICQETFNRSARKHTKCSNCEMDICSKCVKRFLAENVQEPNCMGCREVYTKEFMDLNFGKMYRRKILKTIRLDVLVAREKEFMPDLMHRAAAYKQYRVLSEEINEISKNLKNARKELQEVLQLKATLDVTLRESLEKLEVIGNSDQPIKNEKYVEFVKKSKMAISDFHTAQNKINGEIDQYNHRIDHCWIEREKQFSIYCSSGTIKSNCQMYCVRTDCKGFLDENFACGLCKLKICKDCHEELLEGTDNHICKPENVESVKAILNETKPCPTCRTRVYKSAGCDQMFCVKCHTAFSWNTGAIERGRIHNPHYFEWLRQQREQMPREMGDVPCGGLPNWLEVRKAIKSLGVDVMTMTYLNVVYKMTVFIQNKEIPKYPVTAGREEVLNTIAVNYMADLLTERQWMDRLFNHERKKEINTERRLILDMILAVLIDIFRDLLVLETKDDIDVKVREIDELRKYFNKSIKNLGHRFDLYNFKRISRTWMEWVH